MANQTKALNEYKQTAREARLKVLALIFNAQTSHIGSNFSIIDVMTVLFDKVDLDKDKVILSAGWKAASLYYFLWLKGRITEDELNSYCQEGSKFIGLAEPIHPDIPFAGGSMGYGLPAAVGFALSKKLRKEEGTVYVIMSDGEMQCGTLWEAGLIMNAHKLDNIKVLVDYNGYQAMGKLVANIRSGEELDFVPGHNHLEIKKALEGKEQYIFFKTIKGKGVSFMENDNIWHYKAPNKDEYKKAKEELR